MRLLLHEISSALCTSIDLARFLTGPLPHTCHTSPDKGTSHTFNKSDETIQSIWNNIRRHPIRKRVQQFILHAIHNTHQIGHFWDHIPTIPESMALWPLTLARNKISHNFRMWLPIQFPPKNSQMKKPTNAEWRAKTDSWKYSFPKWPTSSGLCNVNRSYKKLTTHPLRSNPAGWNESTLG